MHASSGDPLDSEELAGFEVWLTRSLYRFDCPEAHTLGEYALDLVEAGRRTRIASHTLACEHCSDELATLRAYLTLPLAMPEPIAQRARRRVAALFHPARGAAYGLRGSDRLAARVYRVDDDITITIAPGIEPGSLIGLVINESSAPAQLAGCEVRLLFAGGVRTTLELDEFGNFDLGVLQPGGYALEIDLPDDVIVIEELQVR